MASINGVTIKGLKTFLDHEGAPIAQGNVYIDGKKVGGWSQDSWGGCDSYWSDCSTNLRALIKERATKYKEGYPKEDRFYSIADDPDCFMGSILKLIEDEKTWKSNAKKGYPYTVFVTDGYRTGSVMSKNKITEEELQHGKISEYCKDIRKELGNVHKIVTYVVNSKDDFDIICDSNHKVPERLTLQ